MKYINKEKRTNKRVERTNEYICRSPFRSVKDNGGIHEQL